MNWLVMNDGRPGEPQSADERAEILRNNPSAHVNKLWYKCAICGKRVFHNDKTFWIDDGTKLFCPDCNGITLVRLTTIGADAEQQQAVGDDESRAAEPVS